MLGAPGLHQEEDLVHTRLLVAPQETTQLRRSPDPTAHAGPAERLGAEGEIAAVRERRRRREPRVVTVVDELRPQVGRTGPV